MNHRGFHIWMSHTPISYIECQPISRPFSRYSIRTYFENQFTGRFKPPRTIVFKTNNGVTNTSLKWFLGNFVCTWRTKILDSKSIWHFKMSVINVTHYFSSYCFEIDHFWLHFGRITGLNRLTYRHKHYDVISLSSILYLFEPSHFAFHQRVR